MNKKKPTMKEILFNKKSFEPITNCNCVEETRYEIRKVGDNTSVNAEEYLEYLLLEFDEYGLAPTTQIPNPEEFAILWKRKLIYTIEQLKKEMLKDCIESNEIARQTYYERGRKDTVERIEEVLVNYVPQCCINEICKELGGE